MEKAAYITNFERLGFGLFVHFGLYSITGRGEWSEHLHKIPRAEYEKLKDEFFVKDKWAEDLVRVAKTAGCKYITLTTRHHDGFSLYDTCGLNDFDAPHSACKRDLIAEFVKACNAEEIVPFFYHTLLDWRNGDYGENFPKYVDYLVKSVEILCKNYGEIGGFWFDGMWDKPNGDWQEDKLYGTIRKYQPNAVIVNNTGLNALGQVGHKEIDSVTFERGKPCFVDNSDKYRAGEMCQVLNDHWGYCEDDCNYKSVKELVENLVDCRANNCNFLLNTGLKGDGSVNATDLCLLTELGKWVKRTGGFLYGCRRAETEAENAVVMTDGNSYYAIIKDVPMTADENVQRNLSLKKVKIDATFQNGEWLDNGKQFKIEDGAFTVEPFCYGTSLSVRVAKLF